MRELEDILGRNTLENEIPREALSKAKKTDIAPNLVAEARFLVKAVADVVGVSRSNLTESPRVKSKARDPI
ncbi:hypothetical protein ASD03_36835 [Ensifer sp. Root127]|nr:hypothetical protein ASD03_36835 [Ensifer sp. Root127]